MEGQFVLSINEPRNDTATQDAIPELVTRELDKHQVWDGPDHQEHSADRR
jgi:hypothetical protein